jgi:hypothetical protein
MKRLFSAALAAALLSLTPLALPRSAAAEGVFVAAPVPSWLATVPSADLFTAKPTERSSCVRCQGPIHSTPSYIGTGSDCTGALDNLRIQAITFANTDCTNRDRDGYCSLFVHPDTCTEVSPGNFQQSGYATYNCGIYIC